MHIPIIMIYGPYMFYNKNRPSKIEIISVIKYETICVINYNIHSFMIIHNL
jgi:hypothetical protein